MYYMCMASIFTFTRSKTYCMITAGFGEIGIVPALGDERERREEHWRYAYSVYAPPSLPGISLFFLLHIR